MALFVTLQIAGCYYRNESDLYPCASLNITYTSTIQPLIESRCTSCHNGTGATLPGVYNFHDYNVVKRVALTDSIYKAVTGQFAGKPRMPYGGPYLSDCEITQIKTWANLGAPQ